MLPTIILTKDAGAKLATFAEIAILRAGAVGHSKSMPLANNDSKSKKRITASQSLDLTFLACPLRLL